MMVVSRKIQYHIYHYFIRIYNAKIETVSSFVVLLIAQGCGDPCGNITLTSLSIELVL